MNKGHEAEDVLAVAMGQVSHAFAAGIGRHADSHIVTGANPRPVDRESASADLAGDLLERVMRRFPVLRNRERGDAPLVRRMDEPNGARRFGISTHAASVYPFPYNCPSRRRFADATI